MPKTGKETPLTYTEMVEQGEAKRATSRIYSTKTTDENGDKLQDLISTSTKDLEKAAATIGKISLSDTDTVKKRTMLYVKACADASVLPSFSGLLRSFGMTARAGYEYIQRRPNSPTGQWLEMYRDFVADLLADAALKGLTHPVFSIFVEKSRNLWRDSITIETIQHDPLGEERTPEDIAAKYANLAESGYFE